MQAKSFDLITLGEIMLRLSPPHGERLVRGDVFHKTAGGAELNVASGVSLLGLRTGIISKLPDNEIGTYVKNRIRFVGVSDDYLVWDSDPGARLGIYYYESGAAPRKPAIVYDRKYASINRLSLQEVPEQVYADTRMFHVCGITLALSEPLRELTCQMIAKFKNAGAKISFDVNYRANLWDEDTARKTIQRILPIDILFVSEETSRRMFQKTGDLHDIMQSYCEEYGVKMVCTTQRTVISPKKHNFTSVIYEHAIGKFYTEAPYEDIDVVDRIGSGDAYVAGVLFGLLKYASPQKALAFGNATSAVKNTIPGDLPSSDFKEISRIIKAHSVQGLQSEMDR